MDIKFLALIAYITHLYIQVGTTSSTAIDPLPALGKIAKVIYILLSCDVKKASIASDSLYWAY